MNILQSMRLRTKQIIILLLCSLIPLFVLGIISSQIAKRELLESSYNQLSAIAQIKKTQIEEYFRQRGDDVESLALSRDITEIYDLLLGYHVLTNVSPTGRYDTSTPEYKQIWDDNHFFLKKYMEVYGYYDIFIMCAKHGHIMFTISKESDLGENLSSGPLKDSGLGSVWRKVISTNSVRYQDFQPYAPSGGAPAAFVAAPIQKNGETIGVVAVQLSLTSINKIMQERTGLGKTGETYIVGPDKRMRSDSFNDPENHSVRASFKGTIEKNGADTEAVREALSGKTGERIVVDYTGHRVLSAFTPITFSRERWALMAEIAEDEVMEPVVALQSNIAIVAIIAGIIIAAIAVYVAGSITKPIVAIQGFANKVATGNLNSKLTGNFGGELLLLADDIRKMVGELKNKLGFAQGVLDGITLPCSVVSKDNQMIFINPQKLEILGRTGSPKDYEGQTSGDFFFREKNKETLAQRSLKENKKLDAEVAIKSDKGQEYLINSTCTPINDLDGALIGSLVIWFDLTEIRKQEQRVRQQHERISKAAERANHVSDQVTSAAEQLAAQIEQSTRGTAVQRERTSETATAIEEMNATIMEVARNSGTAAENAQTTREKATEGGELMQQVVDAINLVQKKSMELKESMADLGTHAEGIGQVMTVITDIADQTNLLALNAAIEAARAGEAGRGFAVVADEVRKLAEKTMSATQEVGEAISTIQNGTRNSIQEMDDAVKLVGKSTELANSAGKTLQQIVDLVEGTADQVSNIATAAEQQSAASEEITRAADEVNSIASETAEAMNQSSQAVASLSELAQELKNIIEDMQDDN